MAPDTEAPSPPQEQPENQAEKSPSAAAGIKVELDIDDAPFLEEEEEQAEEPAQAPEETPEEAPPPQKKEEEEAPKGRLAALLANKKKLALIGGAALFVLIILPLALRFFLFSGEPPPPPPPGPERIVTPATPPREDAPEGPKFLYQAEPFFLERRGSEGEIRFLRCRFSIPTDNPLLYAELMAKTIAVRDAIYYYLNNRPLSFITDNAAHTELKQDLISVINEHVSAEKVKELYIEEYLVTGG